MNQQQARVEAKRVCIVGLGLMGGSLALALRPALDYLAVVDTDPATLAAAEMADLATVDLAAGIRDVDLIILATPVRVILQQLAALPRLRPDGCLVLDLGSTKTDVTRAMEALPPAFQTLGAHPMCGKETAGFAAADPDLYRDQTFILCRNGRTTPRVEFIAGQIIATIGARPLWLSPERHDQLVAAASHLPYLIASALVRTAATVDGDQVWQVSASGFRDTARVAGTSPGIMQDILLTNRAAILAQVQRCQEQLAVAARLLQAEDEVALAAWLNETQRQYDIYRHVKRNGASL